MSVTPVIAIFDVGKTNKKLFLFDEHYQVVHEECIQLPETVDEDGYPCEDVQLLSGWMEVSCGELLRLRRYNVRAVNFSAYGASFVHIDEKGEVRTPLYNYLKPFPEALSRRFYADYRGEPLLSKQTASPVLGSLNSGLQLYRIKHEQPEVFSKIRYSLHLPQYLSYLIARTPLTDLTSVGCHTMLWDFEKQDYHDWVQQEGLLQKFAPLHRGDETIGAWHENKELAVGVGLHDSSAALIPYLASFQEPFVLISTGTWCISLNPFNQTLLTDEELQQDCLCYLAYRGKAVKASRLFAGNEHEVQTKRLAAHFHTGMDFYRTVRPNLDLLAQLQPERQQEQQNGSASVLPGASPFAQRDLTQYASYEEAYHQLMLDLVAQQVQSTQLVLRGSAVKRIFVDGGFGKNPLYMHLLAAAFSHLEVYAASLSQATAMGAALAIHPSWNSRPLPDHIIELKYYGVVQDV